MQAAIITFWLLLLTASAQRQMAEIEVIKTQTDTTTSAQPAKEVEEQMAQAETITATGPFPTGTTPSGEECVCEAPTATTTTPPASTSSNSILIHRPDCDPNDVLKCKANCRGIHVKDEFLADKCCAFAGQSASLLAFEEDSQWVPRLEEFNRCTGAHVRLEYLPEGEDGMAGALRKDLGDDLGHEQGNGEGEGLFDAYIVQAPWLWPVVNGLENLSPRIKEAADTVRFLDINPASRAAVSYNGTVRALPLDTDYIALGWRQDVFHKHGVPPELSPPQTIQDLALLAQQLHGMDFNQDGEGDWGVCLTPQVNYFYAFVAPLMQTALRDPASNLPTGQNMFFDPNTFEPLIHQPAFKEALEVYWKIIRHSNCAEQLANGQKCDRKTAFPQGRCAMVISMPGTLTKMLLDGAKYAPQKRVNETSGEVLWDINDMELGDKASYWGRRAPFPGSTIVQKWDAQAGYPLVGCQANPAQYCPHASTPEGTTTSQPIQRNETGLAQDSIQYNHYINFAPFFAEGGEAYALNGRQAKPGARNVMWTLFTWLSELPETALPLSGSYRKSHLNDEHRVELTENAGWPSQMVDDLFDLLNVYFKGEEEGGNPVQDLLMLGFPEYMDALDEELHTKFLGVKTDSPSGGLLDPNNPANSLDPMVDREKFDFAFDNFVESLEARYNAISDSISGGRMGQLQRWRQSLNLPWRTDEELCFAALGSNNIKGFNSLQCANRLDFEALCQTQPELVANYDPELCASISDSVNLLVLIPAIVVPLIIIGLMGGYWYGQKQKRIGDTIWLIKQAELKFNDPPQIVGRGTFGQVLLAEYRGTQVAVKRALKKKPSNNSPHSTAQEEEKKSGISLPSMPLPSVPSGRVSRQQRNKEHFLMKNTSVSEAFVDEENQTQPGGHEVVPTFQRTTTGDSTISNFASKLPSLVRTMSTGSNSSDYETQKTHFIREMRHLSKLRHPCITTVMGAVLERGVDPMLVMEYCDHGSLYDVLHNQSFELDGLLLLPILRDICQGMRFLHASDPQIIHGDIKAQNILLDSRFRAKISDFGMSGRKGITGTPLWMAPELLSGSSSNTTASDVYSFGIVLYEVYSRKEPYEGENLSEVLELVKDPAVKKRPPVPTECPPSIGATMKECLDSDTLDRPTFEEIDLRLNRLGVDKVGPKDSPYQEFRRQSRKGKAERLLHDVFPAHVADALRDGKKVENENHECVTIFFSDIVGFTTISAKLGPAKVANMLDRLYSALDDLSDEYQIYKCETIGDAYMAITNLVHKQDHDHVKRMVQFSQAAIKASANTPIDLQDASMGMVNIRVGFHSGPVLSGVVGTRLPKYGVFGDTVNTASRMESNSEPMRIHCSEFSAKLLKKQAPEIPLVPRGKVFIKGKDEMFTYWVGEESGQQEQAR